MTDKIEQYGNTTVFPGCDDRMETVDPAARIRILETASKLTGGDRADSYNRTAGPLSNMQDTAALWTEYLRSRGYIIRQNSQEFVSRLSGEDVANMMVLLKMARTGPGHKEDNYVDGAAYFAIAGECSEKERGS